MMLVMGIKRRRHRWWVANVELNGEKAQDNFFIPACLRTPYVIGEVQILGA